MLWNLEERYHCMYKVRKGDLSCWQVSCRALFVLERLQCHSLFLPCSTQQSIVSGTATMHGSNNLIIWHARALTITGFDYHTYIHRIYRYVYYVLVHSFEHCSEARGLRLILNQRIQSSESRALFPLSLVVSAVVVSDVQQTEYSIRTYVLYSWYLVHPEFTGRCETRLASFDPTTVSRLSGHQTLNWTMVCPPIPPTTLAQWWWLSVYIVGNGDPPQFRCRAKGSFL